jgi:glycosyltransferase involved in cell wall biosynthesis
VNRVDMSQGQNIGMVCRYSPHPSHRGFAEAIDADIISIGGKEANSISSITREIHQTLELNDYDILISEGSRPLYSTLTKSILAETKLIYLCSDHRFYELWTKEFIVDSSYTFLKWVSTTLGKPIIERVCQSEIDGVIAVSELAGQFIRPVIKDSISIEISHPYVQPEKYTKLNKVTPSLTKNCAVTVGQASRYKGVDLLVSAWPEIRQTHPNATLHVVGEDHPISYESVDGVVVHGFVDDLTEVFDKASLYIQPSRMDAFAVSVLEALQAGLPAIVTELTGTKSEIKEIDQNMVVKPTPSGLENAITSYFDKNIGRRTQLSNSARNRGEQFNPRIKKAEFKTAFERVIGVEDE